MHSVPTKQVNAGQEQRQELHCVLWGRRVAAMLKFVGWSLRGTEISPALMRRLLKDVQLL